jgi:hypothetical protein
MNYRTNIGIVAVVIMVLIPRIVAAQDPLRVEVLSGKNWNWELTTVKITNVSNGSIELAVPVNYSTKPLERTVNPLPMDVERHDGKKWTTSRPGGHATPWQVPAPSLYPGQTVRFEFAVAGGAGEYRVRVWFFLNHGDPGPPWHPPEFGSIPSNTFEVVPQLPALSIAERPLRLCGTIALSR